MNGSPVLRAAVWGKEKRDADDTMPARVTDNLFSGSRWSVESGVRIVVCMSPAVFTSQDVGRELNTRRIGRRIVVLGETTSTNDEVLSVFEQGAPDGLVVFADYQTRGRGRLGRPWASPRGASVLCSILLIERSGTRSAPIEAGTLTLAAGVAVCGAISATAADIEPAIRWPNDVLIGGKKVAGILIESRLRRDERAYIMGIGINCLQHRGHFDDGLRVSATSLEVESRFPVHRVALARQLLRELDRWLADPPDGHQLRRAWLDRAEPLGQHIELREAGEEFVGRTVDVDPTAGLVVQLDGGGRRVFDPATSTVLRIGRRG